MSKHFRRQTSPAQPGVVAPTDPLPPPAEWRPNFSEALDLEQRFPTGDVADVDRAIALWSSILADSRYDRVLPEFRTAVEGGMGTARLIRYQLVSDPADLPLAIEHLERAMALPWPSGVPESIKTPTNLASAYTLRFALSHDSADLQQTIGRLDRLVQDAGPEERSKIAASGANNFSRIYEITGRLEHLDRGIALARKALADPDLPQRAMALGTLGLLLQQAFYARGDVGALEESKGRLEEAVALTSRHSALRGRRLSNLVSTLRLLGERLGSDGIPLLEQAVALAHEALQEPADSAPDRASRVNALGTSLRSLYTATGVPDHLREAISSFETGIQLASDDPAGLSKYRNNLAGALRLRYDKTGALSDLETAVSTYRAAVDVSPPGAPDTAGHVANLGNGLRALHARTRDPALLAETVAVYEQALAMTPPTGAERSTRLSNLATGLQDKWLYESDLDALRRAVTLQREAATMAAAGDERAITLWDLGSILLTAHRAGIGGNVDEAIDVLSEALRMLPDGSPWEAAAAVTLAQGREIKARDTGDPAHTATAVATYRDAMPRAAASSPGDALRGADAWSTWAMERGAWDEVRTAADLGLQTMRRLYNAQVAREHKESWLRDAQTFSAAAAYAAVRLSDAPAAARAVERGRGLILSEALRLRAIDAERLVAAGHQDLVDRHAALATGLSLARAEPTHDDVLAKRPAPVQVTNVDAVIDEIQQLTGGRDMAAADLGDIAAAAGAAGDAALVYVTAASAGGCAVVVSGGTFDSVELPLLTQDAVQQRVGSHLQAYDAALGGGADAMAAWDASLLDTTRWLWDAALGSLLDITASADLTIVAGGLLGLLPLHAAWTPDPGTATGRRHAIDVAAISYAPNAVALRAAQEVAASVAPERLVAVADPAPTGAPALPGSVLESQAIRSLFDATTVLAGTAATKHAVLELLADADVVHLSCHGRADLGEPLQSGLLLSHGEVLTVGAITDARFAPRLAVLSACETAMPGTVLPDEVTGLSTALLQAGAAGVVASLWAVPDLATAMLMVEFHTRWATDRDRPAHALAEAQRWLRDSTAEEKLAAWNGRAVSGELDAEVAERFTDTMRFRDPDSRGEARLSAWAAFTHVGA